MLKHLDLFSGIGGFALASQMVGGIETTQFVEIDPYCQKVLSKNFPGIPIHGDIATFSSSSGTYDIITGGFPCQEISCANPNGRGLEGKRSGLFFELMRIVRECRPDYVVLENVAEMLRKQQGRVMGTVLWELSQSGYDAEWQTVSAASVGAPHLRERVFIVAYCDSKRCHNRGNYRERRSVCSDIHRQAQATSQEWGKLLPFFGKMGEADRRDAWATEPGVLRVVDGVSHQVDRVRGLGNSIVPQVAEIALQRVLELETALF